MIVIRATMKVKPGQQEAAITAFRAAMAGSQAEAGCIEYRYTADLNEADVYHILELWEDEPSLLAHLRGSAFNDFMGVAGEILDPLGFSAHAGAMEPYTLPM